MGYVLTPAPQLNGRDANPEKFKEHLDKEEAVTNGYTNFCGLDKKNNTEMVVPVQQEGVPANAYSDISAFSKHAPTWQIDEVLRRYFQLVGVRLEGSSDPNAPVWAATHGLQVPWCHLRIDGTPKSVHYNPYKPRLLTWREVEVFSMWKKVTLRHKKASRSG